MWVKIWTNIWNRSLWVISSSKYLHWFKSQILIKMSEQFFTLRKLSLFCQIANSLGFWSKFNRQYFYTPECTLFLSFSLITGLKIMIVCFDKLLSREWFRIASAVKQLGEDMRGKLFFFIYTTILDTISCKNVLKLALLKYRSLLIWKVKFWIRKIEAFYNLLFLPLPNHSLLGSERLRETQFQVSPLSNGGRDDFTLRCKFLATIFVQYCSFTPIMSTIEPVVTAYNLTVVFHCYYYSCLSLDNDGSGTGTWLGFQNCPSFWTVVPVQNCVKWPKWPKMVWNDPKWMFFCPSQMTIVRLERRVDGSLAKSVFWYDDHLTVLDLVAQVGKACITYTTLAA